MPPVLRGLKDLLLAFLSSFLLVLSFPNFDLGFLAWVGLIPLFTVISSRSIRRGLFLSLACGMLFFLGIFHWILVVPDYTLIHHALLAVYLGAYFGFFGLVFSLVSRRLGIAPALFSAPFILVSLEYIRGNLSFLAHPWGLLAHSQYQYPVVIQIASITGTYGISFLIVLVNSALAGMVLHFTPTRAFPRQRGEQKRGVKGGWKRLQYLFEKERIAFLVTIAASLLLCTLLYGYFSITSTATGNKVKISLVQGNIEQEKKWDPTFAEEIMDTYAELTQEVSKEKPDLIIWPETATPGAIALDPRLFMEVINIAKKTATNLLLGSAQHQKFQKRGLRQPKFSNSAYLLHPGPQMVEAQRYDKIRLLPFGEYLPYKDIIPWTFIKVQDSDNYTPGKDFTVFNLPDFRFGVTICWEDVFPDLFRQFIRRGAQYMVNITNEARFGKTAASHQLVAISVFRAVENKVYLVRCANTGVSCIIDPYGRIVDRVKDEEGQDIFVRGTLTGYIIAFNSKTIYTRYGDWFVWIAIVGSVVFLAIAALKGGKS